MFEDQVDLRADISQSVRLLRAEKKRLGED